MSTLLLNKSKISDFKFKKKRTKKSSFLVVYKGFSICEKDYTITKFAGKIGKLILKEENKKNVSQHIPGTQFTEMPSAVCLKVGK